MRDRTRVEAFPPPLSVAILIFSVSTMIFAVTPSRAQCVDGRCTWDSCHTPASGAPRSLWGELEPTDRGNLPRNRDNSSHAQTTFFGCSLPYFEALDIENGWLFVVTNRAFQIWDATASGNPALPVRRAHMCHDFAERHPVPKFPASNENAKFNFMDVDAPAGRDDVAVTVLRNLGGVVIWDTTLKNRPKPVYQDHGSDVTQVYATTIGSRRLAFAADEDQGLVYYDLNRAIALSGEACLEEVPEHPNSACSGVFMGQIGDFSGAGFVDGYSDPARGVHLVAFSGKGPGGAGLEVWDVSDPERPRRTLSDSEGP